MRQVYKICKDGKQILEMLLSIEKTARELPESEV